MFKNRIIYTLILTIIISGMAYGGSLEEDEMSFLKKLSIIQDADLAQKMVRYNTRGNKENIKKLFQKADENSFPRAQIYIANAYHAAGRYMDSEKYSYATTVILPKALESYYHMAGNAQQNLMCLMYHINPQDSDESIKSRAIGILEKAKKEGSVFAVLDETLVSKILAVDFWEAARLRLFLESEETATPEILYWYGESLMLASPVGTELYLEGLAHKKKSGMLTIRFYEELDNRSDQKAYQKFSNNPCVYRYQEMLYLDDILYAPSSAYWEEFEKNNLSNIKQSPLSVFDCFLSLTPEKIKTLLDLYKNYQVSGIPFYLTIGNGGDGLHKLFLSINNDALGWVSVSDIRKEGHYTLVQTLQTYPPELTPLVEFLVGTMTRSGAGAAFPRFFALLKKNPDKIMGAIENANIKLKIK